MGSPCPLCNQKRASYAHTMVLAGKDTATMGHCSACQQTFPVRGEWPLEALKRGALHEKKEATAK